MCYIAMHTTEVQLAGVEGGDDVAGSTAVESSSTSVVQHSSSSAASSAAARRERGVTRMRAVAPPGRVPVQQYSSTVRQLQIIT